MDDIAFDTLPEEVRTIRDRETGLHGVIVLHSTALGPAAGGCRFWEYADQQDMRADAFRLAEGMSYKNALAGLPLGGGKAVLRRPHGDFSRGELFEAFGRAVAALDGRYVTAEDAGTTVDDMLLVSARTRHVAGLPRGDREAGGDPSPWTARGVFLSMRAAVESRLERPLAECVVAIQGLGHVGASLALMVHEAGARLIVSDISAVKVQAAVDATGAKAVSSDEIVGAEADVFAPCALGAVLDEKSIMTLKARVVCGAANNQLATTQDGDRLAHEGILYAPDFVVNAGGIINVAAEYLGWSGERAARLVEETPDRLATVLRHAAAGGLAPHEAAKQTALDIIRSAENAG